MIPDKLTLEPFTEGDGWRGIPSLIITRNGTTPPEVIQLVEMLFCKNDSIQPNPAVVLSSDDAKIVFDTLQWEISVPPQLVPQLTEGEWLFQIKIKPVDGFLETYISDVLQVLKTVRKPA